VRESEKENGKRKRKRKSLGFQKSKREKKY
jgi:hypothetical protein